MSALDNPPAKRAKLASCLSEFASSSSSSSSSFLPATSTSSSSSSSSSSTATTTATTTTTTTTTTKPTKTHPKKRPARTPQPTPKSTANYSEKGEEDEDEDETPLPPASIPPVPTSSSSSSSSASSASTSSTSSSSTPSLATFKKSTRVLKKFGARLLPKGVYNDRNNPLKPFKAQLAMHGKQLYLGCFATSELAYNACETKRKEIGNNPELIKSSRKTQERTLPKGIYIEANSKVNPYTVKIFHEGKKISVGVYKTKELAVAAYKAKEHELKTGDQAAIAAIYKKQDDSSRRVQDLKAKRTLPKGILEKKRTKKEQVAEGPQMYIGRFTSKGQLIVVGQYKSVKLACDAVRKKRKEHRLDDWGVYDDEKKVIVKPELGVGDANEEAESRPKLKQEVRSDDGASIVNPMFDYDADAEGAEWDNNPLNMNVIRKTMLSMDNGNGNGNGNEPQSGSNAKAQLAVGV